jgi:apolipoprotein N-acyltransferase
MLFRYLIAAVGGFLLSAAFPGMGLAGAGWIAPGVILFSALGLEKGATFRLGFVAGMAHYLISLSWLLAMPYTFHGIPIAPAIGWLALSAYCALYPAFWVWLCWKLLPTTSSNSSLRTTLEVFFAHGFLRRARWAFAAALIWVALEMIRARFITGFPWLFLAVSQYKMLPLIQITSVTGVYGLSFLMVWTSISLATALLSVTRKPNRGLWAEAGVPMLVVAIVAGFGATQCATLPSAEEELTVVLIQPSVPQTVLWDSTQDEALFQNLLKLSETALATSTNASDKPTLLVWPEGALSVLTQPHANAITNLLAQHHIWLAASVQTDASPHGKTEYYNSSALFDPSGLIENIYNKRHLVIFGEYIPKWLSLFKWMTPVEDELTPGTEIVQSKTTHPGSQFSTLICFEDIFPQEARLHVTTDTDFLLNLTNDGWFGDGAEQWQHAANAVFRAVENGVPLVRCANNGLTCWIDAQGRLREIFRAGDSVYAPGFLTVHIPLRPAGNQRRTFYNLHGDFFGWSCCGISLCLCAGIFRPRRAALG